MLNSFPLISNSCALFGLYHRFSLIVSGFCMFVLSLVKKHYRLQFYMVRGLKDSPKHADKNAFPLFKCVNKYCHKCFSLFLQFGWTHVTLLIVVTQSHLIIHNLFEGMIW